MELHFRRFRENDSLYKIADSCNDVFYVKRYSRKMDLGYTLTNASDGKELFSVYKKFNVFKTIYEISRGDDVIFSAKFNPLKMYETQLEIDKAVYTIYRHKGLNWSVFTEGKQVAAITKQAVEINNEPVIGFKTANSGNQSHIALVLLFIVLTFYSEIDSPSFGSKKSLDLGYFGKEIMAFNENWQPE